MSERSWLDAIKRVLGEAEAPLHYSDITDQILSRGYYQTDGATPKATVNALIAASIKHKGGDSPFIRVSKGVFALRQPATSPGPQVAGPGIVSVGADGIQAESEGSDALVRAFGMYWQRDLVVWRNEPKLFGKQQIKAKAVDFGKQKGVYILCDHHRVIYVGRATDRPLGKRLYEHTLDRLSGRWDRFSWFGLLDVMQDGSLRDSPLNLTVESVVSTLEALLIEALEPPLNRKRGDDFSAVEYIQEIDPELKERQLQSTLRAIEQKLRGES